MNSDGNLQREALPAAELLTTVSRPGMEVFQLTTNPEMSSSVLYNYAQAVDPTSRYVIINRILPHSNLPTMVDLENDFALIPVISEEDSESCPAQFHVGVTFSRDGAYVYYGLIRDPGRYVISRRNVATGDREDVFSIPLDLSGTPLAGWRLGGCRWLSFSHDGRRLLSVVHMDGGKDKYYSIGLLIFDMQTMELGNAFETGPRNWNNKSQFAPCLGPDGEYLIGLCDCYSKAWHDDDGHWHCDQLPDGDLGTSTYLVDEEGTVKYVYPVGRDRPKQNASHWAWYGNSLRRVYHCDTFDLAPHFRGCMFLVDPVPADETTRHLGRHHPQANQLDLTRHITRPDVYHICVSDDAKHIVCDTMSLGYPKSDDDLRSATRYLYGCTVREDGDGAYVDPFFILTAHSSWRPYGAECLPCMTPDRKWILFNSDYPGVNGYRGDWHTPQVFAIRGCVFPE